MNRDYILLDLFFRSLSISKPPDRVVRLRPTSKPLRLSFVLCFTSFRVVFRTFEVAIEGGADILSTLPVFFFAVFISDGVMTVVRGK